MSSTNPNPFASPAAEPQPSIAMQYQQSGVNVMPTADLSGPRAALAAYRNGTARGGVLAKPAMAGGSALSGLIATAPQSGGGMVNDTPMRNPVGGTTPGRQTMAPGPVQTMQTGGGGHSAFDAARAMHAGSPSASAADGPRAALAGFRASNPGSTIGRGTMPAAGASGAQQPRVPGMMMPNRLDRR